MSPSHRSLHFSDNFVISCGTVTVDQNYRKVLVIHWSKNNTCLLPKGRKDINEDLPNTALRETLEETGYRVSLKPSGLPTLQTSEHAHEQHTEAFAVQQRMVGEKLKIIFWFLAEAGSTSEPEQKPLKEDQEFESQWVAYEDAERVLTFDDDIDICRRALQYC